ncbi:hypothetical protein [Candidatus Uabimicrobium amorphum]|uniref:Uncharacterized protein n=1 Tax=Uabimicrobium amorphum TaxID=2596890 RepID=A0A5S9F335_UABAM|nr:hypothetical protein [Candidatus Uabimicrobium amorphum]BBM82752.1 hypothetical protein UABAM_01095 [Candidatus Uabimicrobium amorphum]
MKQLFLILGVVISLNADVSTQQRQILQPHLGIIENAIPILEKELGASKEKYQELLLNKRAITKKLNAESSIIQQGVLKTKLLYYEKQLASTKQKIAEKQNDLATYYGVLSAFAKSVSSPKISFAQTRISHLEKRLSQMMAKQKKIQTRQEDAQQKKTLIPAKRTKASATLKELQAKLKVLEYKKSWSNLGERTKVISQISYQKGILAKCTAEELVFEKIIEDCIKEQQSLLIGRTELDVALEELRK